MINAGATPSTIGFRISRVPIQPRRFLRTHREHPAEARQRSSAGARPVLRAKTSRSPSGDQTDQRAPHGSRSISDKIYRNVNAVRDLRKRQRLSQRRLAELARTSQPAIAAYESGSKSPRLRTLERLARAVGMEAVVDFVPPLTREERRSLALHRVIASRLEEAPETTLRRAWGTLARMSRLHPAARPLLSHWRALLERPIGEIVDILVDPRPLARELRHVTPFAGVLSARERALVYRQFISDEPRSR